MTDLETIHIARAAASLGDKIAAPNASEFFSDLIDIALAGKTYAEQLPILAELITDAEWAMHQGLGPSPDDIYNAKRRYNAIHELWIEDRLPSIRKETA